MKSIQWLSEREFALEGVTFECTYDDYSRKTNDKRFAILKARGMLDQYAAIFAETRPKNMLEFGIFQGGSPALYALWLDLDKFVGVDICAPVTAFDDFCRTHEAGRRIRSYYGVSQTDRRRIEEIVRTEFCGAPLDVVIDDASHLYATTRRTFEIAFPLLRPGGLYVIEDWGWAHWPGSQFFIGQTPMSMLIMELIMLCASRSDIVSDVRVFPSFAFIRKSPHATPLAEFALDALYCKRGIELVGARNTNLGGVVKLLADRIVKSTRSEVRRFARRKQRKRRPSDADRS
jgi:cephalosporin hydroxylase